MLDQQDVLPGGAAPLLCTLLLVPASAALLTLEALPLHLGLLLLHAFFIQTPGRLSNAEQMLRRGLEESWSACWCASGNAWRPYIENCEAVGSGWLASALRMWRFMSAFLLMRSCAICTGTSFTCRQKELCRSQMHMHAHACTGGKNLH